MSLRMLLLLSVLAVAMATHDDVTHLDYDVIPLDVFPGVGEYFYLGVAMNWSEAMLACQSSAHHLLIIDSDAEEAAMRQMMNTYGATFIHLGFTDQRVEGKYNDILGNPFASECNAGSQWAPGNPKGGATYNCGGFDSSGFQDTRCEDKNPFICEKNKPSGETLLPGYTLIPNHGYYKYYQSFASWPLADQTCREQGTHLVVLNSQEEADALGSKFNLGVLFAFHVGISRFYGGNTNWRTVAGEPLESTNYTRWMNDSIEPAGSFITNPYAGYYKNYDRYGLLTQSDTNSYRFICEHDLF